MPRTRGMRRQELSGMERHQERGSQVTQGSKSPAHVVLSHQASLTKYKCRDKIIVKNLKIPDAEH